MPLRGHGRGREYQPTLPPPWQKCHVQRLSANDGGEWPYLAAVEPKFAPGLPAGFSGGDHDSFAPVTGGAPCRSRPSLLMAAMLSACAQTAAVSDRPTSRSVAQQPAPKAGRHGHAQAEDPQRFFERVARRLQWPGELLQARTENRERRKVQSERIDRGASHAAVRHAGARHQRRHRQDRHRSCQRSRSVHRRTGDRRLAFRR